MFEDNRTKRPMQHHVAPHRRCRSFLHVSRETPDVTRPEPVSTRILISKELFFLLFGTRTTRGATNERTNHVTPHLRRVYLLPSLTGASLSIISLLLYLVFSLLSILLLLVVDSASVRGTRGTPALCFNVGAVPA